MTWDEEERLEHDFAWRADAIKKINAQREEMVYQGKERREQKRRTFWHQVESYVIDPYTGLKTYLFIGGENKRKESDRRGKKTTEQLTEFLKTKVGLAPEYLAKEVMTFLGNKQ